MFKKTFVLDTSAIMSLVQDITTFRDGPHFAGVLADNEIIIPRVVLDELRSLRHSAGDRSKTALEAARQIEQYSNMGSLQDGVETEKGGILQIAPRPSVEKMSVLGLSPEIEDHEILATAIEVDDFKRNGKGLKNKSGNHGKEVVLISQDSILRVLAKSMYGIHAEELKSVCTPELDNEPGYNYVELPSEEIDEIIAQGYYNSPEPCMINEFFHFVDRDNPEVHYCYGIPRDAANENSVEVIDRASVDYLKVAGEVMGKNVRQKLLLWALMGCGESDPMASDGIRLITVSGPAGSGKSFLTLAAAWERLERGHFDRIVITRPMVEVGRGIGFLPGTLEEKVQPWSGLVEDNLRAIVSMPSPDEGRGPGKKGVHRSPRPFDAKSWLEMENRLEIVPLTYVRGRTFRRSFVILEEAQNLERGPLKVLLTRLGEGSVVVVIGDRSQIDNQFLSSRNNGLVHAINAFRAWPQAVHVNLTTIVRSDLADAATRLL
ncbi:MAG: PhoH family protein [Deltaproteobacteria bacterium]|nr:PhoH family protein [Deltaproteobacteria bacterium]